MNYPLWKKKQSDEVTISISESGKKQKLQSWS